MSYNPSSAQEETPAMPSEQVTYRCAFNSQDYVKINFTASTMGARCVSIVTTTNPTGDAVLLEGGDLEDFARRAYAAAFPEHEDLREAYEETKLALFELRRSLLPTLKKGLVLTFAENPGQITYEIETLHEDPEDVVYLRRVPSESCVIRELTPSVYMERRIREGALIEWENT